MSWDCVHEKRWPGNYYEPPEIWCELNPEHDCENCPYYYSEEDYEADKADFLYDMQKDRCFDF